MTTAPQATRGLQSLRVQRTEPSAYVLRPVRGVGIDVDIWREELRDRLLADGAADDEVMIHFVGDVGLDEIFADQAEPARSQGWEGLLLPGQERRKVRMPAGFTLTPDVSVIDRSELMALNRRAETMIDTPHLDLQESMLLRREGDVVGWVPIWRPASLTSIVRVVSINPAIHQDEERRRTHLRLACYAQAVESQCSQGRSVLSWLPDTDDPVNVLKMSVSGPTTVTHWMSITVRRDLQASPS
jgi:hypothetical protein